MPTTVRATYANGVLTPLEPLELTEGCEITVTIASPSGPTDSPAYPNYVKRMLADRASWPPDELAGPPTDLARNKKHHLYGHPKADNP